MTPTKTSRGVATANSTTARARKSAGVVRSEAKSDIKSDTKSAIVDALPSGKVVGAVAGAIKILRYLSNASEPIGVTRIAKETRLNTSTCFNILRTLAGEDLVRFDPSSKSYAISLGIMELMRGATALGSDISSVRPLMERIAREYGVTLTLWQPVGTDRKVLIISALTRNAVRIQMAVGQRLPRFIGATGRTFAAFSGLPEAEIRASFEKIKWDRPLSFAEFSDQVAQARHDGWAMDDGYFATGTISVAVPILNEVGIAVMAVTATMFAGQYDDQHIVQIVRELQAFAPHVERIVAEG